MMLWTAADPAPNPRRISLFCKVKGIDLPRTEIAMLEGAHKAPEHLAKNPRGQLPFLELDDGRVIAETIAICRYLDELHPEPPLFGSNAFERAETDMWTRRAEFMLGTPVAQVWVHGHPFTARMFTQVPEIAAAGHKAALTGYNWFDAQLVDRRYLAGDRFTIADIALLTLVDFAKFAGVAAPDELANLAGWHERVTARIA